jgi:exopolysaccharide biosynthesis polyprenyl glycosylphosphotransferase
MDRSLNPAVRPALKVMPQRLFSRRGNWLVHLLLLLCDQVLIVLAFLLAYWMRYVMVWPDALRPIVREVATRDFVTFSAFLPITVLLMLVLAVQFESRGLYRMPPGSGFLDHMGIIVSSTLIGIALLIVVVFLYRPFFYSRLIFAFAGANIVLLLGLWRVLLLVLRQWCWDHGIGQERVLVVGGRGLGQQVMVGIKSQPHMGYHLVGYLEDQNGRPPRQTYHPHLGNVDDLKQVVQSQDIHQIILALPFWENGRLPELVQTCRNLGVEFRIAPDLYALSFDQVDVLQVSGVPLLGLKEVSIKGWNLAIKRALDVGLVLLTAPLTVPLSLGIAAIIRLGSPGPALFKQQRVGKNGKLFTCYKFRTMVRDAEARQAELAALNEVDGPIFKIRRDPRVTLAGRWLRRSSLDELPQLWNVLCGEMSLVGPRPGLPGEVECYAPWHRRRLEVTPGLTGLWQVLGRSNTTFDEMVHLDIYYAENWSISMDMRILLKTIPAVIFSKGAY